MARKEEIREVSLELVDFLQTHRQADPETQLADGEDLLSRLMALVGFESVRLVPRPPLQCGHRYSQLDAIDMHWGRHDPRATEWLECVYREALRYSSWGPWEDEVLARRVERLIEDTCPMTYVPLGKEGARIVAFPGRDRVLPYTDPLPADTAIGMHQRCGGEVHCHFSTPADQRVLVCHRCGLRVSIPSEVVTYGDLSRYATPK